MSIGALGFGGIGAATPLAQSTGSDVERAEQASSVQQGQEQNEISAEMAEGIGQADGEEHETEDRDADGRRLWERTAKKKTVAQIEPPAESLPSSRDATGECGNELDLTG